MKSIFTKDEKAAILKAGTNNLDALTSLIMAQMGRSGGKAGTGSSKRRAVDYADLGRRGAEARKRKKEAPQ